MKRSNILCMLLLLLSIETAAEEIIEQAQVEALEANSEPTQTEKEFFENIIESKQKEIDTLTQALTELQDESNQLQEQLNAENQNLQKLLREAEESFENAVTSKQNEIDALTQSLTKLQDESNQLQEQLNAENQKLLELLRKAEESRKDAVTSKQNLTQSLAALESVNSDLRSLLAEKVRSITIEQEFSRSAYKEIDRLTNDWYLSVGLTAILSSGATIAVMKMFF